MHSRATRVSKIISNPSIYLSSSICDLNPTSIFKPKKVYLIGPVLRENTGNRR